MQKQQPIQKQSPIDQEGQKDIKVDESWLCPSNFAIELDLVSCPICYKVLFEPLECSKCQRLFCHQDSKFIIQNSNECPLCKQKPWKPKKKIHLAYRILLSKVRTKCNICEGKKENNQFSLAQLKQHLAQIHNFDVQGKAQFFEYFYENKKKETVKLSHYQNLQLYHNSLKDVTFGVFYRQFYELIVDLKRSSITHSNDGIFKLQKKRSQIAKGTDFVCWCFAGDQNNEKFYNESIQDKLQKNYKDYLQNKSFNEFTYDFQNKRYRINFDKMIQINTGTKFKRQIFRRIVKV